MDPEDAWKKGDPWRAGPRVLQFAREDYAGVSSKIQAALWRVGAPCRSVVEATNYLDYPRDLAEGDPLIPALARSADVVVAHVGPGAARGRWGTARRFIYVHGTAFRRAPQRALRVARRHRATVLCSTVDLTRHSQHILYNPTPIDVEFLASLGSRQRSGGALRVAQSPTSRKGKATALFLDAASSVPEVEPVIIEGVSNKTCLEIKSSCHSSFDSIEIGLQVSGLEAMALGHPVIAGGDDYVAGRMSELVSALPYLRATTKLDVSAHLARLAGDQAFYQRWADNSLDYVRRVHDLPVSGERMLRWFDA